MLPCILPIFTLVPQPRDRRYQAKSATLLVGRST
jgi:hypothetical protein